MKCFSCEEDARAVCAFCGRAVCKDHLKTRDLFAGFGAHNRHSIFQIGDDTGITVHSAVWCGHCSVQYRKTY
jgi:hypothetical protein